VPGRWEKLGKRSYQVDFGKKTSPNHGCTGDFQKGVKRKKREKHGRYCKNLVVAVRKDASTHRLPPVVGRMAKKSKKQDWKEGEKL